MGGGALPQAALPSRALALTLPPLAPHQLEERLRQAQPPVIGRLEYGEMLLDLRTVLPEDQPALLAALAGMVEKS